LKKGHRHQIISAGAFFCPHRDFVWRAASV
jgi:hypothetical protein